jgi:hypothetical protein
MPKDDPSAYADDAPPGNHSPLAKRNLEKKTREAHAKAREKRSDFPKTPKGGFKNEDGTTAKPPKKRKPFVPSNPNTRKLLEQTDD